MTEEHLEQVIEAAADRFDGAMNRAWTHRPVRIVGQAATFAAGLGLLAGALPLLERGRTGAARACLIGGGLVLLAGVAQKALIRRK